MDKAVEHHSTAEGAVDGGDRGRASVLAPPTDLRRPPLSAPPRAEEGGARKVSEATLELRGVAKSYEADVPVLTGIDLTVGHGERLSLLGPSGSGKTTLLDLLAGFIYPDDGEIRIGGRDQSRVPTSKRNIGIVFQSHALFPHLSVWENVAFGLRARRVPKAELASRVEGALDLVGLAAMMKRRPSQLSGGQQQRVAFARAVVLDPSVLLLDEPFASLDTALRKAMRVELVALQEKLGIPTVLVTHDQEEALAFGHRVALLRDGVIAQIGSPEDVYEHPASRYVADFIGAANFVPATVVEVREGMATVRTGSGGVLDCDIGANPEELTKGDAVDVLLRPHWLSVRQASDDGRRGNELSGVVRRATYFGNAVEYDIELGTTMVVARVADATEELRPGDPTTVGWGARTPRALKREGR